MNKEIKEILEDMNLVGNYNKVPIYYTQKHIKTLLDYITNLQQENEFLKLNNPEQNMEHFRIVKENKRKIDNLRKENEKLLKKSYKDDVIITKAIEYIEESLDNLKYDSDIPIATGNVRNRYLKPVLNILNGSDENV